MPDPWRQAIGGPPDRPLVVAHRGGAALAAENTLAALSAAEAEGADAIETDVRQTHDGVLVCVHDADLSRLCGDPRHVADLDLPVLRQLLPEVMTLRDVLAASGKLGLLLDFKLADEAALLRVMEDIVRSGAARRVLLGLRSLPLIRAARSRTPEIDILAFLDSPYLVEQAAAAGARWYRLWQGWAMEESVAAVRRANLRLVVMVGQPRSVALPEYPPFPVGEVDQDGLSRIAAIGPDAILLDDPRLLQAGKKSCPPV
ncbi:glycerophosphodiester phosphodiesterase [Rhizobium metallidurans]|uniref:Glycerophosphoryl diester phosphodiesterase n=1 Tax=Rhizobium metallidurans TaxID=1265931 RepID=A0A7W6CS62_9HYPH|nr:glycerophosphodiester phosphodiesterase [Rhizobium metallidurans]MBB3966180.1 glycerophosphoryl diester phosphodiesterase [Rhizobium metallidurans]